jgi:hypothetical protein
MTNGMRTRVSSDMKQSACANHVLWADATGADCNLDRHW